MSESIVIGVVGLGYWGPNLLRNFTQLDDCRVKVCCDLSVDNLNRAKTQHPDVETTDDYESLLQDPEIQAIVVATSAGTHHRLAKPALERGKHVYVEKPLTLDVAHAKELVQLAEQNGVKLMVGHLMEYHPAIEMLKDAVKNNELGDIYYLYSQRVNLGKIRRDENALWSFAPHDISIMMYLLDSEPENVSARGQAYLQNEIEDVVFLNLLFPDKVMAQIQLSWLDPHKIRRTTIVGSKKMAVFDDMEPTEKIRIYDKGVTNAPAYGSAGEALSLRFGDIKIPYIKSVEPLKLECQHFLDCVSNGRLPRSDGLDGLRVVKVLQAAQESLDKGGVPVNLEGM
ncbi:Gfo/Idh/MocA family protein [Candidatus Poribacteria bacterium]